MLLIYRIVNGLCLADPIRVPSARGLGNHSPLRFFVIPLTSDNSQDEVPQFGGWQHCY